MRNNFIFLFGFLSFNIYSQKINFINNKNLNVSTVNVLFKEKNSESIIEFTKIKEGNGTYVLKKKYKSLCIEILCVNYEKQLIFIENIDTFKVYDVNLDLKFNGFQEIEEVVIQRKQPYLIKKDTVIFNVKDYANINDRKIEDLLKRLPGIEVESNGIVSYKGKKIETINLDGDNLLDNNYKIASQNININLVDKVEAIENYTNNPLLKGIESEGKVALNLRFNKGMNQWIGEVSSAAGLNSKSTSQLYSNNFVMQLSSKSKSFSTLNFNNIGRSEILKNSSQNSLSIDKINLDDFKNIKIFETDLFSPNLDPLKYNLNRQFYFSYNNLFKLNKKLNLKINLNYLNDKILSNQSSQQIVSTNNEALFLKDNYDVAKKPEVLSIEPEFRYKISDKIILDFNSKIYFEKEWSTNNYQKNDNLNFINNLFTKDLYNLNKLCFSWKLNDTNLLQLNSYLIYNNTPQDFNIYSSNYNLDQNSVFKKRSYINNFNLIGKKFNFWYFIQIGRITKDLTYFSKNLDFLNNNNLNLNNNYAHINLKYNLFKNLNLVSTSKFSILSLQLDNLISNNNIVEPSVRIEFNKKNNKFFVGYELLKKTISDESIFSNPIVKSNRLILYNNPSLNLQTTNKYSISLLNLSLSKERSFNFISTFSNSGGFYLPILTINNNQTIINNVFYHLKKSTWLSSFRFSDYLEKLSIRSEFVTSLSVNKYPNILNNSDIRNNSNISVNSYLKITSGFLSKINFQEKINYNIINSKSNASNKIMSLTNDLVIFYNLNLKNKIKITNNIYLPSIENNTNIYNFLDFEYKHIYKKTEFYFIINNLNNIKYWESISNDDYSTSFSEINLMPRYLLIGLDYSF